MVKKTKPKKYTLKSFKRLSTKTIKSKPLTLKQLFSKPIDSARFVSDEEIEKGLEQMRGDIAF